MALVTCRDCGVEVSSSAAACMKCGAPVPQTTKIIDGEGVRVSVSETREPISVSKGPGPSKLACALLAFFVPFGIHRFILGYPEIGIAQVLLVLPTCGWSIIWEWIDGVMILTGNLKTKDGRELT